MVFCTEVSLLVVAVSFFFQFHRRNYTFVALLFVFYLFKDTGRIITIKGLQSEVLHSLSFFFLWGELNADFIFPVYE